MSTTFLKPADIKEKKWHVIDAKGKVVGRLAQQIARILQGKHRPDFTPYVESGDGVIAINAKDVVMTGNKAKDKIYTNFSGFPSGIRSRNFERVMEQDPTFALMHAVKGMLPKSRLGRRMLTHFFVYAGAEHPHQAQKPKVLKAAE